jgi:predicted phage terminase large subunit-like protein
MTNKNSPDKEIRPQPGPQEFFLSSPADIIIYGGSAGSGKSFVLLIEPLRHIHVKGFTANIFRRTYPQIMNEGGLWSTSQEIYPYVGGKPREADVRWKFPSGNSIKFAHLEHEKSKLEYQGSQICYIGFDELTHFSEGQFFYLLSRNRSTCGVKPYVRATCNPDPDSWVAQFIAWWINQDTGYPIPERSGVIRYFVRHGDAIYWGDSTTELWEQVQDRMTIEDFHPTSFTFISARLEDNPALTSKDPGYRGRLLSLPLVDRERLLGGNWKIRASAGNMFKSEWFKFLEAREIPCNPQDLKKVRWWDTAATEPNKDNPNPDWTIGVLMGEHKGEYFILDVQRFRKSPAATEEAMRTTAEMDGKTVEIGMEQEPGSAGKREAERFKRSIFAGYSFRAELSTGDKVTRAKPFSSACENGLVHLVRGSWNYDFISTLVNFPDAQYHDDDVDAASAAHSYLSRKINSNFSLSGLVRTKRR